MVSDNFLSSVEGRKIINFLLYLRVPEFNERPMKFCIKACFDKNLKIS